MKNVWIVALSLILLSACKEEVSREFFAGDGISLGEPEFREPNHYFIPIVFNTDIQHSAQWLYDIEHQVNQNEIIIMAKIGVPPNAPKSVYKGGILLSAPKLGEYKILYKDPDGVRHDVGTVTIPVTD